MRAPVESHEEYQARLALERVIHDATRENMERIEINGRTKTQLPYLTPKGKAWPCS